MALRTSVILLQAFLAVGIRLNNKCTQLESGAKIHLKSNLIENHFVTADEGSGDCGEPKKWREEKHWTCSNFHLKEGKSDNSTFRIVKSAGGPIVSGDKVKLVKDTDKKAMSVDFEHAWPYPLGVDDKGSEFEIQLARTVNLLEGPVAMTQPTSPAHKDQHSGEPVCKGDQIFMRIGDEQRSFQVPMGGMGVPTELAGPPCGEGPECPYMYLQGNLDKIVGVPHHFPGFSGKPGKGVRADPSQWYADDEQATSQRFTIVG